MKIWYLANDTHVIVYEYDEEHGEYEFYQKETKAPTLFSSYKEAELALAECNSYNLGMYKRLSKINIIESVFNT